MKIPVQYPVAKFLIIFLFLIFMSPVFYIQHGYAATDSSYEQKQQQLYQQYQQYKQQLALQKAKKEKAQKEKAKKQKLYPTKQYRNPNTHFERRQESRRNWNTKARSTDPQKRWLPLNQTDSIQDPKIKTPVISLPRRKNKLTDNKQFWFTNKRIWEKTDKDWLDVSNINDTDYTADTADTKKSKATSEAQRRSLAISSNLAGRVVSYLMGRSVSIGKTSAKTMNYVDMVTSARLASAVTTEFNTWKATGFIEFNLASMETAPEKFEGDTTSVNLLNDYTLEQQSEKDATINPRNMNITIENQSFFSTIGYQTIWSIYRGGKWYDRATGNSGAGWGGSDTIISRQSMVSFGIKDGQLKKIFNADDIEKTSFTMGVATNRSSKDITIKSNKVTGTTNIKNYENGVLSSEESIDTNYYGGDVAVNYNELLYGFTFTFTRKGFDFGLEFYQKIHEGKGNINMIVDYEDVQERDLETGTIKNGKVISSTYSLASMLDHYQKIWSHVAIGLAYDISLTQSKSAKNIILKPFINAGIYDIKETLNGSDNLEVTGEGFWEAEGGVDIFLTNNTGITLSYTHHINETEDSAEEEGYQQVNFSIATKFAGAHFSVGFSEKQFIAKDDAKQGFDRRVGMGIDYYF